MYRAATALKDANFFNRFQLNKRSINNRGRASTRAAHESIQIPISTFHDEQFVSVMGLYLATRPVLVGPGTLRNGQYWISQKNPTLGMTYGDNPVKDKPLVISDRQHGHDVDPEWSDNYMRYEIVSGDANMSPWAIRMKHGMNMLVMKAIGAGIDFSKLYPANLLGCAHVVGRDPSLRRTIRMQDGSTAEAMDLQFGMFDTLNEDLPERTALTMDDKWTLQQWGEALEEIDRSTSSGDARRGMVSPTALS